jgi:hypothetical protein
MVKILEKIANAGILASAVLFVSSIVTIPTYEKLSQDLYEYGGLTLLGSLGVYFVGSALNKRESNGINSTR